ncbi:unnamed protein product, partial [Prorocentrum cordatum]
SEPHLPAILLVPTADLFDYDGSMKEAQEAAAALRDVCSQLRSDHEKYADDVSHVVHCLDLWSKRMAAALVFWCVAEFSRSARATNLVEDKDKALQLGDLSAELDRFRAVRAELDMKARIAVKSAQGSAGEIAPQSGLKVLAQFAEVVKKTTPGGPFCEGHESTAQACFVFFAQVGSCCSQAHSDQINDLVASAAAIVETAKVDLVTESTSRVEEDTAEGMQMCRSMIGAGVHLGTRAGALKDSAIACMEDMWNRRSGNDMPIAQVELGAFMNEELTIDGGIMNKVVSTNVVEATAAFDQILGACQTMKNLGKPVADSQANEDEAKVCLKALPAMVNVAAFSKETPSANGSTYIAAAGQVLKDIEVNAGPLSSTPGGGVLGQRLKLFKIKMAGEISMHIEDITVQFTGVCDEMDKHLLHVGSTFKKWDEEAATNFVNFEGRQSLKDGVKKINDNQGRIMEWVTGFKGTAVDVSDLETTATRADAARKKARYQIAVRGAVAIIQERAGSKAASYIADFKNKLKIWGSMPALVKQKLQALEEKAEQPAGSGEPGAGGGAEAAGGEAAA